MVTYGDISPRVTEYAATHLLDLADKLKLKLGSFAKPTIDHLIVPCSVCQVPAGTPCRAVRRHINWINDKHAERLDDALVVTEAVRALKPKPDTVMFRRPGRL